MRLRLLGTSAKIPLNPPLRKGEAVGALYERGRLWVPFTRRGGCGGCDHGACSRSSVFLPRACLVGNRESSVLLHWLNTQHLNNTILYFPTNIQIIKLYPILPCLPLGFCLSLISRAWIGAEGFPDQLLKPGVMGLQGSAIG